MRRRDGEIEFEAPQFRARASFAIPSPASANSGGLTQTVSTGELTASGSP